MYQSTNGIPKVKKQILRFPYFMCISDWIGLLIRHLTYIWFDWYPYHESPFITCYNFTYNYMYIHYTWMFLIWIRGVVINCIILRITVICILETKSRKICVIILNWFETQQKKKFWELGFQYEWNYNLEKNFWIRGILQYIAIVYTNGRGDKFSVSHNIYAIIA